MKRTLFALGTTGALLLGTAGAQGATVNQVLLQLASDEGFVAQERTYNFNDVDRTVVFSSPNPSELVVGSTLRGIFEIDDVSISGGITGDRDFDNGVNNALFGRYALEITGIDTTSTPGRAVIEFGHDSSAGLGSGVLFEIYQDTTFNFVATRNAPDGGFGAVGALGADLYAELGDGGTGSFAYNFTTTSTVGTNLTLAALAGLSPGTQIANATDVQLDLLGTGDPLTGIGSVPVSSIGTFASGVEFEGSASILATPTAGVFDSTAAFQTPLTVIPSPSAGLAGLGLLGLGLIKRRRAVN